MNTTEQQETTPRQKVKLTIEERLELTRIVMHDGWAAAFHRLMELAVDGEPPFKSKADFNEWMAEHVKQK